RYATVGICDINYLPARRSSDLNLNNDVTTTADQAYNGAVTLGGAGATRTLSGVNVNLASTVTGAGKNLTVNGSGITTFGNSVSGVSKLPRVEPSHVKVKCAVNA